MTTGQPGELLVIISLAMVLVSGGSFLMTAIGKKNMYNLGVRAYKVQIIFALAATAYLFYLFFAHRFEIEYVYSYSSRDLPIFYLISSFWAGQEGTYLLWFTMVSALGLLILKYGRFYRNWAMFYYSIVNLFLVIMLMVVSPFKTSAVIPPDGAGLNPLLHDFWMVIHPPIMFLAYSLAAVPFAMVLAVITKRDYSEWIKINFPIMAATSLLLLAANAMGGYWAYKTLGWGGYWAWDPVENTSFVPWIISLAVIHGMILERKFNAFRRTNLLMSMLVFLLVVYGTFLTRSGVLADFSVHSFVDLGANAVLISFIVGMLLLALGVFALRHNNEMAGAPFSYSLFSKEFALFAGMILLFLLGAIVMFWSSLPLLTQFFTANPSAAEIATYNSFALPLAILMCLFLTITPMLSFSNKADVNMTKAVMVGGVVAVIVAVLSLIFDKTDAPMTVTIFLYFLTLIIYLFDGATRPKLLTALAYGVAGVILAYILGVRSIANLVFFGAALTASGAHVGLLVHLIPKSLGKAGAALSHFAVGIMLVGILASSGYSTGERLVLPRNEIKPTTYNYDLVYHGLSGSLMDNNNEVLMTMIDSHNNKIDARPQFFFVRRSDGYMKRPYIRKEALYDIYLSPLEIQDLHDGSQMLLAKGEEKQLGDMSVKFIGFEMGSHGEEGGMSVGADLEIKYGDSTASVQPIYASTATGMVGQPIKIFDNEPFEVKIDQVLASEASIVLSFPGTEMSSPPDQLIVEISKKPGINLLWLAIIIACFGLALSTLRKFDKLRAD